MTLKPVVETFVMASAFILPAALMVRGEKTTTGGCDIGVPNETIKLVELDRTLGPVVTLNTNRVSVAPTPS